MLTILLLLLVVGMDGNFFKYLFDPNRGGEARLESQKAYLKNEGNML